MQGKALQKILITYYFLLITSQRPKGYLGKSEEVIGKKQAPRTYRPWGFGSPCWARTSDIMINSHALYRLS